jgi:uncharacterized protein (TIGR02453 family)
MPQNLQTTFDFLVDLRFNNHKSWFDENRARYETAKRAFEELVADLIKKFAPVEALGETTVKDCIYRINRDIRFSKDKTPYKVHLAAVIGRGGRKAGVRSYYVHVQPGESFIAGGLYMPSPEELAKVRRYIALHGDQLQRILAAPDFVKYFGEMEGEKLKTAPKGYASDHPYINLLQYKQFLASHRLTDEQVLSDDLTAHIIEACRALKPFVSYLSDAVQP